MIYKISDRTLTSIADSIRAKTGKTELIAPGDMPGEIEGISGGSTGIPIEVDTLDDSLLTEDNAGKVYKCDDKLYQVNKITSLKGLTIKFNEHITPCTVISEGEVLECSGTIMELESAASGESRVVTEISKKAITDSYMTTGSLSFVITVGYDGQDDYGYDTYYGQGEEGAKWYQFDSNMGIECGAYQSPVIKEFDCPALNESPAFIEWVFANAKVYAKIETLNDIKAFKVDNPLNIMSYNLHDAYVRAGGEKLGSFDAFKGIDGQFTASFSINGEVITKTFSHYSAENGCSDFTNDNGDLLSYVSDATDFEVMVCKYNGVAVDGAVTFTTFDCIFNDSYYFLSYVLGYCDLIDMEYPNGFYFVEYVNVPEWDGSYTVTV